MNEDEIKDATPTEAGPSPVKEPAPTTGTRHTPSQKVRQQIDRSFRYHPPKGDQSQRYVAIRDQAHAFATLIAENTPESREQSLALTHLDQVVMFANAAIARNEE